MNANLTRALHPLRHPRTYRDTWTRADWALLFAFGAGLLLVGHLSLAEVLR
jgi:hypothetical protein